MRPEQTAILNEKFPETAVGRVAELMEQSDVRLVFTRHRSTKLGDFRPCRSASGVCTITLNGDMNEYQTLVTFVHEYAHYKVHKSHCGRVSPHGKEWKSEFAKLMSEFLVEDVFPPELLVALKKHASNPKAGAFTDSALAKTMSEYDAVDGHVPVFVEDVPMGVEFRIRKNGRRFVKTEKLRKRYKCRSLDNGLYYLVSPMVEVVPNVQHVIGQKSK